MKKFNNKIALGAFACTALLSSSVLQAADGVAGSGAADTASSSAGIVGSQGSGAADAASSTADIAGSQGSGAADAASGTADIAGSQGASGPDVEDVLNEMSDGTIAAIAADCGTDGASTNQINLALSALDYLQLVDVVDAYDASGCAGMQEAAINVTNYSAELVTDADGLQTLGDSVQDLVFTPVTPCRIVDTRNYGPGVMSANETRDFYVYGPNVDIAPQGGDPLGCPSPQGEPAAVLLNVTPLTVSGGGPGNIQVYPFNTSPPAAAFVHYKLNTNQVTIDDNAGSFKTHFEFGPREITVKAKNSKGNVVINVMGYYYPVQKADFAVNIQKFSSNGTGLVGTGCTYTGASVAVVAKGPGEIRVTTRVLGAHEFHTSGQNSIMLSHIGTTTSECTNFDPATGYNLAYLGGGRSGNDPTGPVAWWGNVSNERTYKVTTPGTYRYYLNVRKFFSGETFRWYYPAMTATYYPDAY